MSNCFTKAFNKVTSGCEKLGNDIQTGVENTVNVVAENVTNVAVNTGDTLKNTGIAAFDQLPKADLIHLPSPEDVNGVLGIIKDGVNGATDGLVDGVFDATKSVAIAFVPDANLNGLDKAKNEVKEAAHEFVNSKIDFVGDEVKRGLEAAQTTIDAYALAKDHKWDEAGKKFAEGIADIAAAAVPPHIRKALELAKGKTGAVLSHTKEALGYIATGLKEVAKHDPTVLLICAVDKKACEDVNKAIDGAVDGAMKAVYDTAQAGATAVEGSAEAVDSLEKGDWKTAGTAAGFAAAGALQVVGTVYGGVLITGAAGMAAGVTGQFASAGTAAIVDTVVNCATPGGIEKTAVKQVAKHSDKVGDLVLRNADEVLGETGAAAKSASPNPKADAPTPAASAAPASPAPGSSGEAVNGTKSASPNPEANAAAPAASAAPASPASGSSGEAANGTKSASPNPEANAATPDASATPASGQGIDTPKGNNAEKANLGDEASTKVDDIDGPNAKKSDEAGLDAKGKTDEVDKADEAEGAVLAKNKNAADKGMGASNGVDLAISAGVIALAATATGGLGGVAAGLGGLGGGAGSGGAGGSGGTNGLSSGAAQIAAAQLLATENALTMQALSAIAQAAATQAAVLKISNDLNDASVSFMKSVGSGVKSAAQ